MGWGGFTVMPGSQDPFGNDILSGHYNYVKADLLITLCDVFMLDPGAIRDLNVAHWLPVDCDPMGFMDAERVRALSPQIIAMSKFGQRMMQDAGFDPYYVPHGIDVQEFKPPADREALRAQLGFSNENFLIGMNAANKDGPRKAIAEQMQAFAEFHKKHPDSKLLIHSIAQPRGGGLDIKVLGDSLGITDAVMLPDQYALSCGLMNRTMLANWYGILDLLTNCAYGEGFGLPIIEAQACGTPVCVTDWSAMSELCGSGWKVGGEKFWVGGHNSAWLRPSIREITKVYEAAYRLWADPAGAVKADGTHVTMGSMRKAAREFAMQYDADAVLVKYWVPVLEELEAKRPKVTILDAAARSKLEPVPAAEEDTRRDMLLIIPSRGRPESISRMVEAVTATAEMQTDIIFGFDEDDPALEACVKNLGTALHEIAPRMNQIKWTNHLALKHAGEYRVLVCLGDDHVPRTPGFDKQLLLALDAENIISYPNDQVRDDIPEVMVVRSEAVQALGWMLMPGLEHYFCDNVWADLGKHAQAIAYLPDVIVEHMHHLRMKDVVHDETYKNNETHFWHDKAEYEKWRATQMKDDVEKIRATLKVPEPA